MEDLSKQLHDILDKFGTDLNQDLIESLRKKGVTHGGGQDSSLAGSIAFKVYGDGLSGGVVFTMADYWEFVEYGRKAGKMPRIDAIMDWIRVKGIIPKLRPKAAKKAKTLKNKTVRKSFKERSIDAGVKSLAFAIAKTIEKKGTIKRFGYKGSKFISEVLLDGRITKLEEEIAEKIGLQIVVDITEALKPKVKV